MWEPRAGAAYPRVVGLPSKVAFVEGLLSKIRHGMSFGIGKQEVKENCLQLEWWSGC